MKPRGTTSAPDRPAARPQAERVVQVVPPIDGGHGLTAEIVVALFAAFSANPQCCDMQRQLLHLVIH